MIHSTFLLFALVLIDALQDYMAEEYKPCLKVISPIVKYETIRNSIEFEFSLQCPLQSHYFRHVTSSDSSYELDDRGSWDYCISLTTSNVDPFQNCFLEPKLLRTDPASGWTYTISSLNNASNFNEESSCINMKALIAAEQCSSQSRFSLTGFKSNSLSVVAYIKISQYQQSFHDHRLFFTTALLDTDAPDQALPPFDVSLHGLMEMYPTVYNNARFLGNILGTIASDNPITQPETRNFFYIHNETSLSMRLKRHGARLTDKSIFPVESDSSQRSILIYLKEMQRHGANNRLITWACGLASLTSFQISILTSDVHGDEDLVEYLYKKCKVPIYISSALSISHIEKVLYSQELSSDAMQLIAWIGDFHTIIVTNSNGELQTDMLLINYLPRCATVPVVLVDASNPILPSHWLEYIDAVVAPSKAAALFNFMPIWNKTDIPFGVIYSSLSYEWIQSASCWDDDSSFETHNREKVSMVCVGRLAIEKNPGVLLKALSFLFNSDLQSITMKIASSTASSESILDFRKHFHMKLIGDGPLRRAVVNFITTHNLTNVVTIMGDLSPSEVQKELKSSIALVNPGIYGETFGLVNIEALTMGKPAIAFNLGGTKESLHAGIVIDYFGAKNDFISESDPVYALAEAILSVFSSRLMISEEHAHICRLARDIFNGALSLEAYCSGLADIIMYLTSL